MNINDYAWADSNIEGISIEFDKATIEIWNYSIDRKLSIVCSGLAGITNLCIWDDTIIESVELKPVSEYNTEFLRSLLNAYDKDYDYGGKMLKNGLLELRVLLVNKIPFSVYCQSITVSDGNKA